MLTQKRLKQLLDYNPETGVFTWLRRKQESFHNPSAGKRWKTMFEGKPAGSVGWGNYVKLTVDGRYVRAHRLAFLYMEGDFPPDQVDHINGNPKDNRWANLRKATPEENSKNTKIGSTNSSGVVGVSLYASQNKWVASICHKSKTIYLGYFDDFDDAVLARKEAEKLYNYHPNHGRQM